MKEAMKMVAGFGFAFLVLGCEQGSSEAFADLDSSRTAVKSNQVKVELDVLVNDEPLAKYRLGGMDYVLGQPGQEYKVMIQLDTPVRFLSHVYVDGIDVEGEGGIVTNTYRIAEGFRINRDEVAAFTFSPADESLAAKRGKTKDIGQIRAEIFLEENEKHGHRYHHKFLKSFGSPSTHTPNLGTAGGRRIASSLGWGTSFIRRPGGPAAVVGLRYDDKEGLCRRGVVQLCP
jgi:hypothetical protein